MSNNIAIRDAYGEALVELGGQNPLIVALEADVGSSSKSALFGKKYPQRYYNVGISEINMVAMAAGLACEGLIPFVNTFAVFLTSRALDPIQSLIAYDGLNVKLAGTYCGLSDSYDGASHHSITDLSALTALPGMTVISPCDAAQTRWATVAASQTQGPVYLRLSRAQAPDVYDKRTTFEIGKGKLLREGKDVTLVATGTMVSRALDASKLLSNRGIEADVVDIHTVKPLDEELLCRSARKTHAVVVCEEHSIHAGLGALAAQALSRNCPTRTAFVGMREFAQSGAYEDLLFKYKLDATAIAKKAEELL